MPNRIIRYEFVMPPTSKKLRGYNGLGLSVCLCVHQLHFAYGQEWLEIGL